MKTLATATAIAALFAAPAFAQDTTPTETPPAATEQSPAAPDVGAPEDSAATPDSGMTSPAPDIGTAATVEPRLFLGQQSENEMLASDVMGAKVYNSADEELGTVNDIVFAESGEIEGVILGVGGFLGIGAKSVAVSFEAIQQSTDKDGNVKLMLDATKDELTAAPDYVTVAQLKRDEEINNRAADEPAASPETPAPADPLAPAPEPPATQ
jgi:sporulation protein YlmC with PRC-barrel domain